MKAFIIDQYSKKDPMRLGEMPTPAVRDDDVLIEVHAAGLNLLDSKIKAGEFKQILATQEALAYIETGRSRGKVVVKIR